MDNEKDIGAKARDMVNRHKALHQLVGDDAHVTCRRCMYVYDAIDYFMQCPRCGEDTENEVICALLYGGELC